MIFFAMIKIRRYFLFILLWFFFFIRPTEAQYIPVHTSNQVYEYLTELSNSGLLNYSTYAKPSSRLEIGQLLSTVEADKLNSRQKKELDFYLGDFRQDLMSNEKHNRRLYLLSYSDSSSVFFINPVGGGDYFINEKGSAWHWRNGAEAWGTIGKWGFWGSLRDNHESQKLTQPKYLNQNSGAANFKNVGEGKIDYWEFRGGISYDFGVGSVGIVKDHFSWGSNYNGANILSGRTQSFAHIHFQIKPVDWFEFRYVHGWLVSEVVDSSKSFFVNSSYGTDYREVYHNKFMAANFFSFRPLKKLNVSIGNSIIYDYDSPHLAYFIPVMFYKAVDHHLNSGIDNMNSQIFLDVSSRLIQKTHMYFSLFIDELAVKRITDPEVHNLYSFKTGFRFDNIVRNLYGGVEYTITNALTFQHYVNTTTFESNQFNLGHYLTDNAKEIYLNLGYRPIRNFKIDLHYTGAKKGPDHTMLGTEPRTTIKPFTPIVWESDEVGLNLSWQIINHGYLRLGYTLRNVRGEQAYLNLWTPEYYHGKTGTINMGLNFGF
jgi:hypothetical protein